MRWTPSPEKMDLHTINVLHDEFVQAIESRSISELHRTRVARDEKVQEFVEKYGHVPQYEGLRHGGRR